MYAAAFEDPRLRRAAWRFGMHHHDDEADTPRRPGRGGGPRRPGPGFGGPGGPFGPGFGGGPGFGRRGRSRRGDIRAAVLALLSEQPMHGYQIITELESRSQGAWRPSPGSVYPTLQALEDQGLVRSVERDGRKVIELTTEGQEAAAAVLASGSKPWEDAAAEVGDPVRQLMGTVRQIAMACTQVVTAGNARQVAEAQKVLTETRRRLYQILADDEPDEPTPATQ